MIYDKWSEIAYINKFSMGIWLEVELFNCCGELQTGK